MVCSASVVVRSLGKNCVVTENGNCFLCDVRRAYASVGIMFNSVPVPSCVQAFLELATVNLLFSF